ncbi:hypothetical protein AMR47_09880 [Leptospira interrogans]|nr:hypothetical protein AMR47_09880 [Leptospira interrogans]
MRTNQNRTFSRSGFLKNQSYGKFPVLEKDGILIFETGAI